MKSIAAKRIVRFSNAYKREAINCKTPLSYRAYLLAYAVLQRAAEIAEECEKERK